MYYNIYIYIIYLYIKATENYDMLLEMEINAADPDDFNAEEEEPDDED